MRSKAFKDISLSRLGMGNMGVAKLPGDEQEKKIDWEESQKILDCALANGINYFDTAYVYDKGDSERCVGHCLKKHPRDSFYLATKFNINFPEYEKVFAEQLERLQTAYIDFYLIHCLLDNNIDKYIESGAIEFFKEQKAKGRIKYLGFSSHSSIETLTRFADLGCWDFAQIQLNYFDWNYSRTAEEYKVLEDRNIPIMVMEPVRGGRLAQLTPSAEAVLKAAHPDWSIASWALRFVMSKSQTQVILSGMSSMEQLQDNLATFSDGYDMTEEDLQTLQKACDEFHSSIVVPCTECRYCCEGCPVQINIPEYLKIYNSWKVNGGGALRAIGSVVSEGKPADCIGCGQCNAKCPQSIKIPEIIAELAEAAAKL